MTENMLYITTGLCL